jgi:hypothetical protein
VKSKKDLTPKVATELGFAPITSRVQENVKNLKHFEQTDGISKSIDNAEDPKAVRAAIYALAELSFSDKSLVDRIFISLCFNQ